MRRGFSLVELLVALLFTMILMAGMALVFKTGLSTFVTTNESYASARHGRTSLDLLHDDINDLGLQFTNLTAYSKQPTTNNPGFFVVPNVDYTTVGLDAQTTYPLGWSFPASTADQLYLFFDEAVPYDATLKGSLKGIRALDPASPLPTDKTFTVHFDDEAGPETLERGMVAIFRDAFDAKPVSSVAIDGREATITSDEGYDDESGSASGSSWLNASSHRDGAQVLFVKPMQQVRYRVVGRNLDPSGAGGLVPCLVREQGPLGGAFDPSATLLIAENVIGFKVFLSADQGANWAGLNCTTAGQDGDISLWKSAYLSALKTPLSRLGRAGRQDPSVPFWFREAPILVRIDLLTRTVRRRTEFGGQEHEAPTAEYGTTLQTLILIPRHSGLPLP